jgi:RHS repeat-associated protein
LISPGLGNQTISQASGSPSYSYDANGNLTGGAGRTYSWTIDNLPLSVSQTSGSESYSYDADGERVKLVRGSTTTVYLEGLWEEPVGGAPKLYYSFNGQLVVLYTYSPSAFTYLHADHLGSVSVATDSNHALVSQQEYDPWGQVRSGGISQTNVNYTGQRLDGTGLLYYHARLYDPGLGRFVSADSIVPGADALAIGSGGTGGGPANPQSLNRYSYVQNNPLRYTDPSGHCLWDLCITEAAAAYAILTLITGTIVVAGTVQTVQELSTTHPAAEDAGPAPRYSTDEMGNPIAPVADSPAGVPAAPDAGPTSVPDARPTAAQATEGDPQKTRSPYPPGDRYTYNTKKGAREAAKRAGGGNEPVHDPYDEHGPHYHPGDGQGGRLNHDHYYYPKLDFVHLPTGR